MMYIARLLYPVKVLGPGNRIGIWMSGCEHFCRGCSNPELWNQQEKHQISLGNFKKIIEPICENYDVRGFTITGGDPFFQPEALAELLPYLYSINHDVLVYTGYDFKEIEFLYGDLLRFIAVLIDGKYMEEQNHGSVLKGSDNQNIIFVDKGYEKSYKEYLSQTHSKIQNFTTSDGIVSVGIHLPGYEKRLIDIAKRKGLEGVESE